MLIIAGIGMLVVFVALIFDVSVDTGIANRVYKSATLGFALLVDIALIPFIREGLYYTVYNPNNIQSFFGADGNPNLRPENKA